MEKIVKALACVPLVVLALLPPAPAQEAARQGDPLRAGEKVPDGAVAVIDGTPVSIETFVDAMVFRYARPTSSPGQTVLKPLTEEALVKARMREQHITVTEREVEDYIAELDARSRKASGKGVRELLEEQGQDYEAFRKKVPHVVGLTKLARADLKTPEKTRLTEFHLKLWIEQNLRGARVERDAKKLPPGALLDVEGAIVPKLAFVEHLVGVLDADEVRRVVNSLLQEILVRRMLARHGLELTEADILAEYEIRKRQFETNPVYKGIRYEDVLREQTGFTPEELRKTHGFQVHAGVGLLARRLFTRKDLETGYEKHRDRYGPVISCRHILVQASDNPRLKGKMRTFDEALIAARSILDQLRGGMSFTDAARLYSSDQSTRYKGGVLPDFTPGRNRYDKAFVNAALAVAPGNVSEPVRTPSGWHIIKVEERKPAPPVESVSEDLSRYLASELFLAEFGRAKVGIDVTAARLRGR